jgi:hypothetical protein
MTTPPVQHERRVGQRFPYLLPLFVRQAENGVEGAGFTQDLSSCGVLFFTDVPLREGSEVEITLRMPSEITLGESMPVRCRGRILRIIRPSAGLMADASGDAGGQTSQTAQSKISVAVRLEGYEYLNESSESSPSFERVSALHSHSEEDRPADQAVARPVAE